MNKIVNKIASYKMFDYFILITSNSGNQYRIFKNHCTCKGFGFHGKCSHYDEATKNGLIDLLIKNQPTEIDIRKSPIVIKARRQALKIFLEKNHIKVTENLLDKIEPTITTSTKPQDVLQLV